MNSNTMRRPLEKIKKLVELDELHDKRKFTRSDPGGYCRIG
jgi:hypothetical protein